jgi:hypothetical protein
LCFRKCRCSACARHPSCSRGCDHGRGKALSLHLLASTRFTACAHASDGSAGWCHVAPSRRITHFKPRPYPSLSRDCRWTLCCLAGTCFMRIHLLDQRCTGMSSAARVTLVMLLVRARTRRLPTWLRAQVPNLLSALQLPFTAWHHSRPFPFVRTMELFRKYCVGDGAVALQMLSDPAKTLVTTERYGTALA